jgi:hypothetical protein
MPRDACCTPRSPSAQHLSTSACEYSSGWSAGGINNDGNTANGEGSVALAGVGRVNLDGCEATATGGKFLDVPPARAAVAAVAPEARNRFG